MLPPLRRERLLPMVSGERLPAEISWRQDLCPGSKASKGKRAAVGRRRHAASVYNKVLSWL